jgi:adenylate cyclase
MWPVGIDFEKEGLLDGAADPDARLELLRTLEEEGFTLDELRAAAAQDRLALLPVERVLSGEGKLYTREELAEETGLEPEFLDQAARALGVPIREPGERAITEEELELARSAKALLDAGIPREAFLDLTSVMTRSMSNIAASFASIFGEALLHPGDTERDVGLRYAETLRQLGPLTAPTLRQMFNLRMREQMRQGVITQAELQSGRLPGAQAITVGFVDIVGFTRLGEDAAPDDVGAVVRRFERAVAEAVEPPVRLVKSIGDAVMLVSPEPTPLVHAGLGLVEASRGEGERFPQLRVGIAAGPAMSHMGDWYGRPVNIASRVTNIARADSVLATRDVRDAIPDAVRWSSAGARTIKGVPGPIRLYRARPLGPDGAGTGGSS